MEAKDANPKQVYLFEKAPYLKAILILALPSILSQLILVIYNIADTYFIGLASQQPYYVDHNLTNALVAGVTICMPIYTILTAISNLFGIGASSVMSRSMGKKNYERARNASRFAFWGCLAVSIIYCLIMLLALDPIAGFISGGQAASSSVKEYAKTYILITVVICGVPTTLNTLLSHLFRAEGKSTHAMIGIVLGGVLNIALDPLLIFCLPIENAVMSAAVATGVSNCVALIYYLITYLVLHKKLVISFKFKKKMFNFGVPGETLLIGLPACLMTLCENISFMVMDNLIGSTAKVPVEVATASLAGVGAAKKINMFPHSITRGMTQGVLPLIGYNKSSGNRHRMRMITYISGGISIGIALVCMVINMTCAMPLSSIFLHEQDALELSAKFLIIFSIGAPFSALAYTVISFFQAVGKPWRSLLLALLRKGILDIPLMFILQIFIPITSGGVVWATPIADIVCSIIAIILFLVYINRHGHNSSVKPEQKEEIKIA